MPIFFLELIQLFLGVRAGGCDLLDKHFQRFIHRFDNENFIDFALIAHQPVKNAIPLVPRVNRPAILPYRRRRRRGMATTSHQPRRQSGDRNRLDDCFSDHFDARVVDSQLLYTGKNRKNEFGIREFTEQPQRKPQNGFLTPDSPMPPPSAPSPTPPLPAIPTAPPAWKREPGIP